MVRNAEFSARRLEMPAVVSSPSANSMHGRRAALVSARFSGVMIVAPTIDVKWAPMERAGEWLYSKSRMSLQGEPTDLAESRATKVLLCFAEMRREVQTCWYSRFNPEMACEIYLGGECASKSGIAKLLYVCSYPTSSEHKTACIVNYDLLHSHIPSSREWPVLRQLIRIKEHHRNQTKLQHRWTHSLDMCYKGVHLSGKPRCNELHT